MKSLFVAFAAMVALATAPLPAHAAPYHAPTISHALYDGGTPLDIGHSRLALASTDPSMGMELAQADGITTPEPTTVPTPPVDVGGAVGFLPSLIAAFHDGHYEIGVALVLMILVFVTRSYVMVGTFGALSPNLVPWITMAVSVAVTVATSLLAGRPAMSAVFDGLGVGLMAVGAWEAAGKHAAAKANPG